MGTNGYDGLSKGQKWGCASALVIGTSAFLILSIVDALGDCAPDETCQKGMVMYALLPSAVLSIIVFFAVQWITDQSNRK